MSATWFRVYFVGVLSSSVLALVLSGVALVSVRSLRRELENPEQPRVFVPSHQAGEQTFEKDSPEYVLQQYWHAGDWKDRLSLVLETPGIEERMARRYANVKFPLTTPVDIRPARRVAGGYLQVDLIEKGVNVFGAPVQNVHPYYIRKVGGKYLVDWESSTGWQPMSWTVFQIEKPRRPLDFRVLCRLTSIYAGCSDKEGTHYCLELGLFKPLGSEERVTTLKGLVPKESSAGRKVAEVLSDGQAHPMILTVQFVPEDEDDIVRITRLVSDQPYIYDREMATRYTAPLKIAEPVEKLPFELADISGSWTREANVLGGEPLFVPELRFKVVALQPIKRLTFKVVYWEKRQGETQILSEDIEYVVSGTSTPFGEGYSKVVISSGSQGYLAFGDGSLVVGNKEAFADLYYDIGHGYRKSGTHPIEQRVSP